MTRHIFLKTKFHQPAIPDRWVVRPGLLERLNEGIEPGRQMTLVSAPAGFGKTTCISSWLSSLHGWSKVWLSLDESDDDPIPFFTCFIIALQKIQQNFCKDLFSILSSGQLPPEDILSTVLTNELLEIPGRYLLVMDDFHIIQDQQILKVFERILPHLPTHAHFILISREDPPLPLAQLRAQNRLTDIRSNDLRFSNKNTTDFLTRVMALSISPEDIELLEKKTEGWVVGLQLAALSMKGQKKLSELITSFSGSHRYILTYLAEQVLDHQPNEVKQFLYQTSILEKLNADLCNAVTQRSDSHQMLERLINANLFLSGLDDEQRWYRFHHLFADLLREILISNHADDVKILHRRAAQWYANEGIARQAVTHALAARDFEMSVKLLESYAMDMVMQGYARTVAGWLQEIPKEWRTQSFRVNLAFIWMNILQGNYHQALPYMQQLQEILSNPDFSIEEKEENKSIMSEWLVLRSLTLMMEEKIPESEMAARQALQIAPKHDERVKSLAFFALASTHRVLGDYPRAVELYRKSIRSGRSSKILFSEMMSEVGLSQMAYEHGELELALELSKPICARIDALKAPAPIHAVVYGVLSDVHYQRFALEEAYGYIQRACQMSSLGGNKSGIIFCHIFLSRLYKLLHDEQRAAQEIQTAADLVAGYGPLYVEQEVIAQQVQVHLMRNNPAAAQLALQEQGFSFQNDFSYPAQPLEQGFSHSVGLLYNASLHLIIYLAKMKNESANIDTAIKLAGTIISEAHRGQYRPVEIESHLLRARLYSLKKNVSFEMQNSRADYLSALELGEPEKLLAVFIEQGPDVINSLAELAADHQVEHRLREYAHRIINIHSDQRPTPSPFAQRTPAVFQPVDLSDEIINALTEREMEVLILMAQGLKYTEIANQLFISLNTVRYHVKAIYGKLNVNNRTQAIDIARRLRLL